MRKLNQLFKASALALFAVTAMQAQNSYCEPTYSGWAVDEPAEPITLVQFGVVENLPDAINQSSPSEVSTTTPRYEDFSDVSVIVVRGESYTLKVKGNTNGDNTNYITIYFDWNGDGVFSNSTPDSEEAQQQLTNQPEKHQHTTAIINSTGLDSAEMVHTVTIPTDAFVGQIRMRIVKNINAPSNGPCSNPFFPRGQVEDYTLNIIESSSVHEVIVTTQSNVPASITTTSGTLQLVASVLPTATAPQDVTWSIVEGSSAVSVSENGLVTALVNNGSAVVRATSDENETKFDEIEITIAVPQTPAILDFEDNFETSNDWTFVNQQDRTTKWVIGNAVNNGGAKSLYVSDDNGATHSVDLSIVQTVHAYRDIEIPTGTTTAELSFDWMSVGDFYDGGWGYDVYNFMEVWIVPNTYTPTGGNLVTNSTNHIKLQGNHPDNRFLEQSTFVTFENNNLNLSAYAGQTARLVFTWRNINGTSGLPSAIDNVELRLPTEEIIVTVATQNNASTTLTVAGEELQLIATVIPATSSQDVTWSLISGDEFVTVSEDGLVTAIDNGTATIRATSVEDTDKYDEIQITVLLAEICDTFETFLETFDDFTTFPEQCWAASTVQMPAMVTLQGITNKAVQLYSFNFGTQPIYIVTPEITTIDGQHVLKFDVPTMQNAEGVQVQFGTLSSQTDFSGFVGVGEPFTPVIGETYTSDAIPAQEGHKYAAIKFIPNGVHKVIRFDNVEWKLFEDASSTDNFSKNAIKVYPNPTTGLVSVESGSDISEIVVFNTLGQRVISVKSANQIDLSSYPNGIYLLEVRTQEGASSIQKIVKK